MVHSPPQKASSSLHFCALASGSKGNAVFVSDGNTSVLVDAGLSGIELQRRMEKRQISPQNLDAIVVSHEHTDHIQAVGVLARRFQLPVYLTSETSAVATKNLGKLPQQCNFSAGQSFSIGTLDIHPFPISHDAADPVGFTFSSGVEKIGIATDLGIATGAVIHHLTGCSALLLEANHDPDMLHNGPYPWPVKQRIKSRTGHLANEAARDLLGQIAGPHLHTVVLGHLSETNNTREKALSVVSEAVNGTQTEICAASQHICGDIVYASATLP